MAFEILLFLYLFPIFLVLMLLARFVGWVIRQLIRLVAWFVRTFFSLMWKLTVWLWRLPKKSRATR